MRLIGLAAVLLTLVIAGCRTSENPPASARSRVPPATTKGGGLGVTAAATAVSTNQAAHDPVVLPVSGRIYRVFPGFRFVVIDYTLGGMPPVDSVLNVYRGDQKVGQVRLSSPPPQNGFAAADIVEGFVQVDDEVRLY